MFTENEVKSVSHYSYLYSVKGRQVCVISESRLLDGARDRPSTLPKCSIQKHERPAYTSTPQYLPHMTLGTGTKHTVYALCVSHIDHHASCGDRATLLPRCPPVAARLSRQVDVGSRGDDAVVPPKQGRRPTPKRVYGYACSAHTPEAMLMARLSHVAGTRRQPRHEHTTLAA